MYRVEDPVFAMAESFFLDGGSRLDDVDLEPLTILSGQRSVAYPEVGVPDVGRSQYARCSDHEKQRNKRRDNRGLE
jgi:hypothetical protein